MIKISGVTKNFEDFRALDKVDLHVEKGAVYGLVGPNGAGKTTLLRHITGVYRPDAGTVLLAGMPVYENPQAKEKFAYIPDDFFYFAQSNTKEMMKFYKGIYPKFDEQMFLKLQEIFPEVDMKKKIGRLSKGMQKQVAFWLSVCCKPELLILDEPVDGLDPVMRRQIWSVILSNAAEHGTTVLVSSHNLRELEDVCDHVGIMNRGKMLLERSLSDLQENISKVQIAFAGDVPQLENEFNIVHASTMGRVHTMIIRGNSAETEEKLAAYHPLILDVLPLTLEEIFIYELGGENYAVKEILI